MSQMMQVNVDLCDLSLTDLIKFHRVDPMGFSFPVGSSRSFMFAEGLWIL